MNGRIRISDIHRPFIDLVDRIAILSGADPFSYRRIRLHLTDLQQWFAERAAWHIIANRELIRLVKVPARADSALGFRSLQSPLDYELMVWVLWFGERMDTEQFLLSELVEEIALQATASCGVGHVEWANYSQRHALRRALGVLEEMGALHRLDGSTEDWANTRSGNTLYEFTGLAQHLGVETTTAPSGATSALRADQRLYRMLLLSPSVFAMDDPEAFSLLKSRDRRQNIIMDFQKHFGWDLEVSGSHACLLRPAASEGSEQALFPSRSAIIHPIVLLCGVLRRRVESGQLSVDGADGIIVSLEVLEAELAELNRIWGSYWGSTLGQLALSRLTEEVISMMRDWAFLEGPDADGLYRVLPLAARFTGEYRPEAEGLLIKA
jgi:uncharacterized protein (TIGR02678 family)